MLDSEPMIERRPESRDVLLGPPRHPGRPARVGLLVIVAVLAVAGIVVWGIRSRIKSASAVRQETLDLAVPSVSVVYPKRGAPKNEVVLPGNMQAFTDSPIYARASGYLKEWHTDIGARVKAGQLLAVIEAPELSEQVSQAKAELQQAQGALDQTLANYQQGKANEELARVTAQRWNNLSQKGVVSRQENDQYQAQYQSQIASLQSLEKAIAASKGSVASAEANLSRLEELERYLVVKAPFDGVITVRNTDVGALVNAGNGGPAQELFHMASTAKLRVYVNVPEVYSRAAIPGVTAELTLAEFPGRRFNGQLVRNAEAIDATTRTLLTEVDVDNSSGVLLPGAYAEVHLKLPSAAPSLILPVGALLFRSEGLRIGVVRDGDKVELVPVTIGKDYGTEVEIASGIAESDAVIANPPDSLISGAVVHVVPQDTANKQE
jgi:RND family efflux transporter MFP subunit